VLRASWKSLLTRKLRLLMSAVAVILGVAFVAGSLVFTDTLAKSFDGIMTGSVGDVVVQPTGTGEGAGDTQSTKTVPGSLVAKLAALPGAARADGQVFNAGTFVVSKQKKLIGGMGAPGIAVNASSGPAAHGVVSATITKGRWPDKAGEIALDPRTYEQSGYQIGEMVTLVTSGKQPRVEAKLVGVMKFASGSAGASISVFETRQAQQLFFEGKDEFTAIWVTTKPGVSQDELRAQVAKALPSGVEAVTGDAAAKKAATQIQKALGFINTFLLVFAAVALVVGSFLIINTFSILVAQRGRELALFRALGASRRQVGRSVLFEALVIGLVGSAVGLGLGLVLAVGIKALFGQLGLDLSEAGLALRPRTVIASFAIGTLMTLFAAYLPARRAGRVPPVAAMRDDVESAEGGLRKRVLVGGVLIALGVALLGLGLFTSVPKATYWVGGGIFCVVIGVALTSPLVGRPLIAGVGWLYRKVFGAVGLMAQENAQRNPRRTAATASALMIGVTLVSMMAVFGASAKASVDKAINKEFVADYVVSNAVGMPFSMTIVDDVRKLPGVGKVSPVRMAGVTVNGGRQWVNAIDPATVADLLPTKVTAGSLTTLRTDQIAVSKSIADFAHLSLGQRLPVEFAGTKKDYTIGAIYERNTLMGTDVTFTNDGLVGLGMPAETSLAYVVRAPGASAPAVKAELDKALADLPTVTVKDQGEFAAEQRKPIDQVLFLIYALLGLAVVIAILGIINTLSLSVIERTREIGLLRAVGLSRVQLRRMLRLESVVIALLGAALGVGLGIAFGIALQRSLSDDGIDVLAIPIGQLVAFVVLAGIVGVFAALWPGWRAGRLDILRAITNE
jgi:putative ABC transport system permease protein